MSIFRTQNRVPEVYPNMSRDFQILCRALDMIQNGVKFDIDGITDVLDTDICDSSLLPLLQTKVGFYTDNLIPDDDLRVILKAFPHIKFYKGSLKGIRLALNVYMKLRPTELDGIYVTNKSFDKTKSYTISIVFTKQAFDLFILDEILKYIIPPGYNVNYTYAKYADRYEVLPLTVHDFVTLTTYSTNSNNKTGDMLQTISNDMDYNSYIRSVVDNIDLDCDTKFLGLDGEIASLDDGTISRIRSSVNVGTLKYKEVELEAN